MKIIITGRKPEKYMKTRLILRPGQKGTKRLTDKYGDALVCVRFRYDAAMKRISNKYMVDEVKYKLEYV